MTWIGHATVLIEMDGVRLLTDPALRSRMGPLVRVAPPVERANYERIDAVLLSHLHSDHADLPSLRLVGQDTRMIAPAGAGRWLAQRGQTRVEELAPCGHTRVGSVAIHATAATHDDRRKPFGPRAAPVGFVARGSSSVYFAGDTDLFDEMSDLAGSIDLALLPIWGWGSSLGPGHLDPDRAAEAAEMVAAGVTVPIHWGTYALWKPLRMTQPKRPPREWAPELFARRASEHGATRVTVLDPGERIELTEATRPRSPEWRPQQARN